MKAEEWFMLPPLQLLLFLVFSSFLPFLVSLIDRELVLARRLHF